MSVKEEYDLDSFSALVDDGAEEQLVEIEQVERSADIDIKLEYPIQLTQFSLTAQQDNNQQDDYLTNLKDPLELDIDEAPTEPIPKSKLTTLSTSKKIIKINPAICTKCNISFPAYFIFEQHMIQIHQDDRPYPCKHCGKPFTSLFEQKRHETIHNPKRFQGEPQFSCDLCPNSYHLQKSLQSHKSIAHLGYKPPKRKSNAIIREHHSTSGSKNPNVAQKPYKIIHSCSHCDLTFDSTYNLRKHMIVHSKDRTISCSICQESFSRKDTLAKHMKNLHQNRLSAKAPRRPQWQANEPCPCTHCEKIFPIPSLLARHMLVHVGKKPHSCNICKEKFRTKSNVTHHKKQTHLKKQLLSNPLKLYKCRICGKNDFVVFNALKRHRDNVHKTIPYDCEAAKCFGCGICGKPYFLREDAIICALLSHDPTKLRKEMFKVRCPECPSDEIFGYHNYLALRKHWNKEHGNKQLPSKFRVGMSEKKEVKDELPSCRCDQVKREHIKINGFDPEEVKSEVPLYVEFDLLELAEQGQFTNKRNCKVNVKQEQHICTVGGLKVSTIGVLTRHVQDVHGTGRKDQNLEYECKTCGKIFTKAGTLRAHTKKISCK